MRMKLAVSVLALCALGLGCGPLSLATCTLVIEPIHYCATADNIMEWRRDYKLAEAAWKETEKAVDSSAQPPPLPYSPDYGMGFKDGFADHLYAGGTGEPPPLPPRHYWKMGYETPEGHQAIDDWFAGFRHGAAVACASGYRQWVTVPTSLPPRQAPVQQSFSDVPESSATLSSEPTLPPPRKLPPSQDSDSPGQQEERPADPSPPSVPSDVFQDGAATGRESGSYQGVPIACSWPTHNDPSPKRGLSLSPQRDRALFGVAADKTAIAWSDVTLLRPRKIPDPLEPHQRLAPIVPEIAVASSEPILLRPRKLLSPLDSENEQLYVNYPAFPLGPVSLPK